MIPHFSGLLFWAADVTCCAFFFFFLFIDSQMWFTSRLVHIFISGSWMLTKANVEASVNWLWVVSLANLYVSWQQRSKTGPFLYAVIIQGLSNRNGKITLWHFVKIRYWIIRKPWWQVKKVFTGQSTRKTAHQHPSDTPLLTFRLFFCKVAGVTSFQVLRHIWGKCFGGQTPQWHTLNNKKKKLFCLKIFICTRMYTVRVWSQKEQKTRGRKRSERGIFASSRRIANRRLVGIKSLLWNCVCFSWLLLSLINWSLEDMIKHQTQRALHVHFLIST